MTLPDFYSGTWLELDWSDWMPLDADSFTNIPKSPGLYRIRHQRKDRDFLEYIGESGDTRRRIGSLTRGVYADEMPYRDPHTAAPCLWAVRDSIGPALEVSYTTPSKATEKFHRKGLEEALIALHRRETGRSPTANFGRMMVGYRQSSYSYNEPAFKGGALPEDEVEPNSTDGVEPPGWDNWRSPLDRDWMGLLWSESHRLGERLAVDPPDNGLYRIWYPPEAPPLTYVGESSDIPSRLYNHEQTFGEDAVFAFAERLDLDAAHKRSEIETDLIGAHYLAQDEPPTSQFG